MNIKIGKHLFSILIAMTGLILVVELFLHFLTGYRYLGGVVLSFTIFITTAAYYVFLLICVAATVLSAVKHQHKLVFTLSWLLIAMIGQIPKGHFYTLGALYAVSRAGAENVISDALLLANKYPPKTCIGYAERFPCDNPISYDTLPPSIKNIYPAHVLILEDYVLIEKEGLQGVFRGFVVFRNSPNIWDNEEAVLLQAGCSICWKVRIVDGLYWYHADPSASPIFMSSLK